MQNTGKAHGAALGADEVAATKELLGFDPAVSFEVEDEVLAHAREVVDRGGRPTRAWDAAFAAWRRRNPSAAALLDRLAARRLPDGWTDALPTFPADAKGMATRKASGEVLNALAAGAARAVGRLGRPGRATTRPWRARRRSCPRAPDRRLFPGDPYGRTLHFGIREHAMGAILNGIALHGRTRPVRRHVPGLQRLHARRCGSRR